MRTESGATSQCLWGYSSYRLTSCYTVSSRTRHVAYWQPRIMERRQRSKRAYRHDPYRCTWEWSRGPATPPPSLATCSPCSPGLTSASTRPCVTRTPAPWVISHFHNKLFCQTFIESTDTYAIFFKQKTNVYQNNCLPWCGFAVPTIFNTIDLLLHCLLANKMSFVFRCCTIVRSAFVQLNWLFIYS